ncbi:hypothetical protein HU200_055473 [Digitaria exilis]|uniref:Uncharacterized protein n=1 Tax=Digitaria exilis TaxID=1010633 RepID=A0A835AI74_9POAL|nr:hypothetical protein HU200_055473 [Digitaria exilis]CAB3472233.1 unnamed protein product [Digitaria exilis]
MKLGGGTRRRDEEAGNDVGAAPEPRHQAVCEFEAGVLGLAVASAAIALAAARQPPRWLNRDAYFIALSVVFFVGVAQVTASVWATTTGGRRAAAGRKLLHASAVALPRCSASPPASS